jgi:DNA-directed RNA polymerase III subunit RPC1
MENNDRPVDFDRLQLHTSQLHPCNEEPLLLGEEFLKCFNDSIAQDRFQAILPVGVMFIDEIKSFFSKLAARQAKLLADVNESTTKVMINQRMWNTCRMTRTQMEFFLTEALSKYTKAYVEPGEAIGATGAQSISEPGTQMTLKVRASNTSKYSVLIQCAHQLSLFFPNLA